MTAAVLLQRSSAKPCGVLLPKWGAGALTPAPATPQERGWGGERKRKIEPLRGIAPYLFSFTHPPPAPISFPRGRGATVWPTFVSGREARTVHTALSWSKNRATLDALELLILDVRLPGLALNE